MFKQTAEPSLKKIPAEFTFTDSQVSITRGGIGFEFPEDSGCPSTVGSLMGSLTLAPTGPRRAKRTMSAAASPHTTSHLKCHACYLV